MEINVVDFKAYRVINLSSGGYARHPSVSSASSGLLGVPGVPGVPSILGIFAMLHYVHLASVSTIFDNILIIFINNIAVRPKEGFNMLLYVDSIHYEV